MDRILELLKKIHPDYNYEQSNDFIEDELLDSFDVIELVDSIEKEFGIKIDGIDILPENFNSIDSIKSMIKRSGGIL